MKKKGSMDMVGIVLAVFVGAIVALSIFSGSIVPTVGQVTTIATITNDSLTSNLGVSLIELKGRFITNFIAINETTGTVLDSNNYTIVNNVVNANGDLVATINATGSAGEGAGNWNVSYGTRPDGYIDSAGGRSMTLLIAVFSALAIAVGALVPSFRSGVMNMFGK